MLGRPSTRSTLARRRHVRRRPRRRGGLESKGWGASRGRLGRRLGVAVGGFVVAVAAFVAVQLARGVPAPTLAPTATPRTTVPGVAPALPFPAGAEVSLVVPGAGTLARAGNSVPTPIASVTKIMTCLVVLHDHPLAPGAGGPSITVTPADVAAYQQEKAAQDSVVPVVAGERLTERQALESVLVPSADNVAGLLARWDAGSVAAFVERMNAEARRLGLRATRYAGPSGVDPATVSTAADEARLATIAMTNATFAQIVAMPQVVLPVAGLQYNVNADLGSDGIVGVKTGWIPAGGASFVFAAARDVGGRRRLVIGAVVGERQAPPLPTVLADGRRLARAATTRLEIVSVVATGTRAAVVTTPTGDRVAAATTASVRLLAWPGATVHEEVVPVRRLSLPLRAGERVGTLVVAMGAERAAAPLVTVASAAAPSVGWRITHL